MPVFKRITLAVIVFAASYAAMLFAWRSVGDAYAGAFRGVGNRVFRQLGDSGDARFYARSMVASFGVPASVAGDVVLILRNHRTAAARPPLLLESFYYGYLPTIVFVALLVATPSPAGRRILAMGIGLLVVHGVIAFRVWLFIVSELSAGDAVTAYRLPALVRGLVEAGVHALVFPPASGYVLALFVWLAVAFRLRDWIVPAAASPTKRCAGRR